MSDDSPIPDFSRGDGLLPAIAQDAATGQVLMMAWMNREAFDETLRTGRAVYYSRSRGKLWRKGEESGHVQHVQGVYVDCDADTILLKVQPDGPACHTGETSCFFTQLEGLPDGYESTESGPGVLDELFAVIQDRQRDLPEGSYTSRLLQEGVDRIAQKVIEEAGETAIAAVQGDQDGLPREVADLLYHALVLLAASGTKPSAVWEELRERRG